MVDPVKTGAFAYGAVYVVLAIVILFVKLLPLGSVAGDWPGPDLILCLTLAWVLRRPDYLPALLIAVVVLLEDLLLMRPPGLWAALVVLAAEFLRSRVALTRALPFMLEWLLVATVMVAVLMGYRLVLAIAVLPQAGLGQALLQVMLSILCYPVVVGASRLAFGVRKPATGEVDAYGRRL